MSDAIDIPNAGADANRCIGGLRTLSEPMLSLSRRSAERADGDAGPCCCWLALLAVPGRVEWGDGDRRPWGDEEPDPDPCWVRKAEEALLVACCSKLDFGLLCDCFGGDDGGVPLNVIT